MSGIAFSSLANKLFASRARCALHSPTCDVAAVALGSDELDASLMGCARVRMLGVGAGGGSGDRARNGGGVISSRRTAKHSWHLQK